jgi:hypothetical protein
VPTIVVRNSYECKLLKYFQKVELLFLSLDICEGEKKVKIKGQEEKAIEVEVTLMS